MSGVVIGRTTRPGLVLSAPLYDKQGNLTPQGMATMAGLNRIAAMGPVVEDVAANIGNYPPGTYSQMQYYATDTGALYVSVNLSGTWTWVQVAGGTYSLYTFLPGMPAAGQSVLQWTCPGPALYPNGVTFGPNFSGIGCALQAFPAASAVYTVYQVSPPYLNITAASVSGSIVTYTYTTSGPNPAIGGAVVISAMKNAGNDGTFQITGTGSGTFTVTNASGVNESSSSGSGNIGAAASVGTSAGTGTQIGSVTVSTSGLITPATVSLVSITAAAVSGSSVIYSYTTTGPALYVGEQIVIASMTHQANDGTFRITALGSGTFTVPNSLGVNESGSAGTGATPYNFTWGQVFAMWAPATPDTAMQGFSATIPGWH